MERLSRNTRGICPRRTENDLPKASPVNRPNKLSRERPFPRPIVGFRQVATIVNKSATTLDVSMEHGILIFGNDGIDDLEFALLVVSSEKRR